MTRRAARLYKSFQGRRNGRIWRGDALAFLSAARPESADLVFLDPPFNLGKAYAGRNGHADRRPEADYQAWLFRVLAQAVRVLKPGGTMFLYHIPQWAVRVVSFLDSSLEFQHWIAISMKNGFVRGHRLYPAHYALLMFSKGRPRVLRRPKIRPLKCASCKGFAKSYGGYHHLIARRGVNLSDVWDDLSPVRHAANKHRAANELHPEILKRIMRISAVPGGLYVDPFAGTGSGPLAAVAARMRFLVCDLHSANCKLITKRIRTETGGRTWLKS